MSTPEKAECSFLFRSCGFNTGLGIGFEEERNAPNTADTDESVDKSAQNRITAAEYPGNKVKLKNTYKSPVQRTDYYERKRDSVNYGNIVHQNAPPFYVHNAIVSLKNQNMQKVFYILRLYVLLYIIKKSIEREKKK